MIATGANSAARCSLPMSIAVGLVWTAAALAEPSAVEDLAGLSLEELSNLEVTSVSKTADLLRAAPAAIYVITHDEIIRSGVTSIAEALRLAPNLHVSQYTASEHIVGARGFAGAEEAQNFSNKLLILIDGRSVYSPLYSGVYLDVQDVLMEDIDRIEVISGPGATLWGANAMNGVINVITRPAYLTDETVLSAGIGNLEQKVTARHGGRINDKLAYRIYGKAFERDEMKFEDGRGAGDDWYKGQLGFRMDWTGVLDSLTAQGDVYRGVQDQLGLEDQRVEGVNLLGRWQRRTEGSEWQVQAYVDHTSRGQPVNGIGFELQTYDIELQHMIEVGARQRVVWGAGARWNRYDIDGSAELFFVPERQTLRLGNAFVQDTISLSNNFDLTLGLKFELDPYGDWEPLPDIRAAWELSPQSLLWASASRAIRAPTPFDTEVREAPGGGPVFLVGNPDFQPEQVDALELGYRGQPHADVSFSISAFYNMYEDLKTVELTPVTLLPLVWGNSMEGETYGVEAWAKWQATEWWRLSPGIRYLRKSLEFSEGASRLIGLSQSGNDPRSQALLTSSMDIGTDITFDTTLRYVDTLPQPRLDSYIEMNASVQWHIGRSLDVSLSGFNLLDSAHREYPAPTGELIRRSVLLQTRWRF